MVMSGFGALRWILLILLIAFTALMVFAIALGASAGVPLMGFHAAFAISGVFAAVVLVLALARVR